MSLFRQLIEGKITPSEKINFDKVDTTNTEGQEEFHKKHAPSTNVQALRKYTSTSSNINSSLWKGEHHDDVQKISDGIKSAPPAQADFHVYTGISAKNVKEKGDLHIPAFTSTSTSKHVASSFVSGSHDRHSIEMHPDTDGILTPHTVHHIIDIHIKKGQHVGAYIASHSNVPGEKEFLINKNHTIHMTGTYEDHHHPPAYGSETPRIYRIHHATIDMDD